MCVCVCVYVCVYICTYVYLYIRIYVYSTHVYIQYIYLPFLLLHTVIGLDVERPLWLDYLEHLKHTQQGKISDQKITDSMVQVTEKSYRNEFKVGISMHYYSLRLLVNYLLIGSKDMFCISRLR